MFCYSYLRTICSARATPAPGPAGPIYGADLRKIVFFFVKKSGGCWQVLNVVTPGAEVDVVDGVGHAKNPGGKAIEGVLFKNSMRKSSCRTMEI